MGRVCEDCGADKFKAEGYDRLLLTNQSIIKQRDRIIKELAVAKADAELKSIIEDPQTRGMQAKIERQKQQIKRMEDRLRNNGLKPYKNEQAWTIAMSFPSGEKHY